MKKPRNIKIFRRNKFGDLGIITYFCAQNSEIDVSDMETIIQVKKNTATILVF